MLCPLQQPFQQKDFLWEIAALVAKDYLCLSAFTCWTSGEKPAILVRCPKLEGSPVRNRRWTKHSTISFGYCSLKLCSFRQRSKPWIPLEKCIKRLFFQPSSPSTCISAGNAGCLAGISHGVQQQKDCFPSALSKPETFSPGPD